jgi:hypothetical protein
VEASFSLARDVIGCRQSKTTGERLRENVVVRQIASANNGILVGDCAALDTAEIEDNLELKKEAEERTLHTMAKVNDFWRCCSAAKTNVLHRKNLALKTCK